MVCTAFRVDSPHCSALAGLTLLVLLQGACSASAPGAPGAGGDAASTAGVGGQVVVGGAANGGALALGGAGSSGALATAGTGGSLSDAGSNGGTSDANNAGGGAGGLNQAGSAGDAGGIGGGGGQAGAGAAGADCGVDPVTPNATAATRKVLCYLHSIYGNHILSGQEEDNDDNSLNVILKNTGKYPAIRAFDVNNDKAPTQCVDQWNHGGLCMFGYHMGINGHSFSQAENIDNVLKSGTSENKSFNLDLDRIAQYVQPLQAAGGVAIMRPFHEAGKSCSWFWWSMGSATQWQELFKYEFNYLTATKGLKNLLWIAPLCGSPDSAHNPGSKYIDFGGADDYVTAGDYEPLTNLFHSTESAFPNMMVALHECGAIPDPDQLKSSATKWLFFNVWSGAYINAPNNSTAHLKAVYASDYVITRDELPSFK